MAYTLPNSIAGISDISITTHIDCMGPRQIKAFEQAVRSGFVGASTGAPVILATAVRAYMGLPVVHIHRRSVSWNRMDVASEAERDAFFTAMQSALCAAELGMSEEVHTRGYNKSAINALRSAIAGRDAKGSVWAYGLDLSPFKLLTKKLSVVRYEGPMPAVIQLKEDGSTAHSITYKEGK